MNKECEIRAYIPPKFPYLKYFHTIDPSVVTITKPLNGEILEACCEGLK